jgi:hypothetical protein
MFSITRYDNVTFDEDIICDYCKKNKADFFCFTQNSSMCCKECKDNNIPPITPYPIVRTGKKSVTYSVYNPSALNANEVKFTLTTHKTVNSICTFTTLANTESTTSLWDIVGDDVTEDKTTGFKEFVRYAFEDSKDFIVTETKEHVILIVIRKREKLSMVIFRKNDEGRVSSVTEGHGENPNESFTVREEKRQKKEAKKKKKNKKSEEIYAVRGDGSVTTLDRLLRNEPDLAPSGTFPSLNVLH